MDEFSTDDLAKMAAAIQGQLLEVDIQLQDSRKARNTLEVRLNEIYLELRRRGLICSAGSCAA